MLDRRSLLAVAAAALAAAACAGRQQIVPPPAAAPPAAAQPARVAPATFRVMTYNIHHGEGLDGPLDLERIAALIRGERADVVALQEVDKGVERTARRDIPAELAALTGMAALFRNNFPYQGGEYGNAVNDTPGSRTCAAMAAMFDAVWARVGEGDGFTIPSREPNKRIDYLWLRKGWPIRPARAWVPRSDASDHLPLVAEFAWQ